MSDQEQEQPVTCRSCGKTFKSAQVAMAHEPTCPGIRVNKQEQEPQYELWIEGLIVPVSTVQGAFECIASAYANLARWERVSSMDVPGDGYRLNIHIESIDPE